MNPLRNVDLAHVSERWVLWGQDKDAISLTQRGIEKTILRMTPFIQVGEDLRSSDVRRCSRIRDAHAWVKSLKIWYVGHTNRSIDIHWTRPFTDWIQKVKRTPGRPKTRWSYFMKYNVISCPRTMRAHLARYHVIWVNKGAAGSRTRKSTTAGKKTHLRVSLLYIRSFEEKVLSKRQHSLHSCAKQKHWSN